MRIIDINKIDIGKLSSELNRYEKQWIAISRDNVIVSHGKTYEEAQGRANKTGRRDIVLFKVPPLNYSLSP